MKKNLLVTLADKNYIEQAKQLFSSVYWNAGWKGDYMLLAHEIPEKDLKWFRDKGILIKKCKLIFDQGWTRYPPLLLDKFYLFTPEFKKWKNVIYLDADIIVRASLDELTKVKGVAAVPDFYFSKLENQIRGKKRIDKLNEKSKKVLDLIRKKYNLNRNCFNAGFFAFNTNLIKKNTSFGLIELFHKYGKYTFFGEQTTLNLFFYKKWKRLPSVYNIFILYHYLFNREESKKLGIILHFVGPKKPWNLANPFYNEWKTNLKKADLIDLKKVQESKKWTKLQILLYSKYVFIRRSITRIFFIFDEKIGKFGIFLRKYNPNLYHKLKKIEKKIRR